MVNLLANSSGFTIHPYLHASERDIPRHSWKRVNDNLLKTENKVYKIGTVYYQCTFFLEIVLIVLKFTYSKQ